jgi:hypothetical protein
MINAYIILIETLKKTENYLRDFGVDESIILKWFLRIKYGV